MKIRIATALASLLMLLALCYLFVLFLNQSASSLTFPFGIDYGEGIVWQQTLLMLTPDAYGSIEQFPAIVFHYTPIYHAVVLLIAAISHWDILFIGRAVSICSTLLIAILVALIVVRAAPPDISRRYCLVVGVASGILSFSIAPVYYWSQLMRVDMLALFFSLTGFWFGLQAFKIPSYIYLTALFFVAAVYTKQTQIIAPVAIFGLMFFLKPRLAIVGLGACLIGGLSILAVLFYQTEGRFIRHIFLYNINVFDFSRLYIGFLILIIHGYLIMPALVAISVGIFRASSVLKPLSWSKRRDVILSSQSLLTFMAIFSYFALATPMLILFAKEGAAGNYVIEWFLTVCMLIGVILFDSVKVLFCSNTDLSPKKTQALQIRAIGIPLLIGLHVLAFDYFFTGYQIFHNNPIQIRELETLSFLVQQSNKPVISDEMVMIMRSGKRVVWEPAIFAQLDKVGLWNADPFEAQIRRNEFAMFITEGARGDELFDGRYSPAIADAMDAAYPLKQKMAGFTLHLPPTVDKHAQ
jgi:hypothetical protein